MAELAGKTCVVTGANSGLGRAISRELAARGATVVMLCRDKGRGEAALRQLEAELDAPDLRLRLIDLASLTEVRQIGSALAGELDRLNVLINNAGVYRAKLEVTADGFEMTIAVNHLAHFLLTHLLLGRLRESGGRVVSVSSDAHRAARLRRAPLESILRGAAGYRGFRAYADSKAANILFTHELARRFGEAGVTATAVHPGAVATRIWNQNRNLASLVLRLFKPFMKSAADGARPVVRAAADASDARIQGRYFDRLAESRPSPDARDPGLARELWELSARLTSATSTLPPP